MAGPKGSWLTGNLTDFGQDPLGFLEKCVRDYGDFVPLQFLHQQIYLLNDPADIEDVLTTQARNFRKTFGYRTPVMRRTFGAGLVTSEETIGFASDGSRNRPFIETASPPTRRVSSGSPKK